jgi:hypothetical protein
MDFIVFAHKANVGHAIRDLDDPAKPVEDTVFHWDSIKLSEP